MQGTAEAAPSKRRILRDALSGDRHDFTEGSLTRGIALLAIPTVLEMAMESTFGLVDAFWVARLGADAIAAVGLTESLIVMIFSIAAGLSMAATATVARRIGEKDPEGASVAAVQAILCGLAIAAITGICGILYAPQLLGLMDASSGVVAVGSRYTRIMLGGNVCILLLFLINGVFRGAGDPVIAMRTLWLANLVNLALDPCLIYGYLGFPKTGPHRRGGRHHHRPQHRRALPALGAVPRLEPRDRGAPASARGLAGARADAAPGQHDHRSILHLDGELGEPGAHQRHVRQRGGGRLHALDPRDSLRADALLGYLQRGRHAGGPEPRGREARALRARGVACGRLQHDLPDGGRGHLLQPGAPHRHAVHR